MAKQTVALYTVTSGDRLENARSSLAKALGDATLGDADDGGLFEVTLDAESPEAARELVREALGDAGTGDDFVIGETTEGREMDPSDPRQGRVPEGPGDNGRDASSRVADAASAVAAAASAAAGSDAAASARETVSDAASSARDAAGDAASSVREAVDDKGVAGAASDYASAAAEQSQLRRFAPIAGLLLLLLILRRLRR